MWDWIGRWLGTRRQSPLEVAFLAQQKLIEDVVTSQREFIAQQQATLDRIVTSRYDRPIERVVHPQQNTAMPEWAMSDQGDVRPAKDEIGAGIAALHVDSDADFIEATN